MTKDDQLVLSIVCVAMALVGILLVCFYGDWRIALGMGLFLWADNIDKKLRREKE